MFLFRYVIGMSDSIPLTPKQHAMLQFISIYFDGHGYMPTTDEMAAHAGLAGRSGALRVLRELEARKYIKRTPRKPRAIRLIKQTVVA
jgi:SOS-response transcriptional repressor LexA